jgi:hypothetical protein
MSRRAAPFAAALALTLACPEVFASSPVPSNLAFRSALAQPAPAPAETVTVAETTQEPAPAPAPQPYADPSAPAPVGPQPYAQPAGAPATATVVGPPPTPRSRRKGLMIGGWVMFGSSYLATAFVAAIVHDTCSLAKNPNCRNAATMTLIPAIGPFLAIPHMQTDAITPRVLMAFPALIQIAGLTMAIVGTAQFVRDGREPRYVGVDGFKLGKQLRLGVAPTRVLDGGTLTLGARF